MRVLKKFFSNAWVVGILCSVIATGIVSAITSFQKQINIVQAIILVFQTLWGWLITVLRFRVPVFVILLLIVVLLFILKLIDINLSKKESNTPQWLNYKRATYKNWVFAWDYKIDGYSRKYDVVHLRPICQCGCELSLNNNAPNRYLSYGTLICPKCSNTYPEISEDDISDFKRVLIYDIQNDLYPKQTV